MKIHDLKFITFEDFITGSASLNLFFAASQINLTATGGVYIDTGKDGMIALGTDAAQQNQPENAIAIGKKAGGGTSQTASVNVAGNLKSSIILNASITKQLAK